MTHLISLCAPHTHAEWKKKHTKTDSSNNNNNNINFDHSECVFPRCLLFAAGCLWAFAALAALSPALLNVSCSFFSLIKSWFDVNYTRHICVAAAAPQFCDFAFIMIILWLFFYSRSFDICSALRICAPANPPRYISFAIKMQDSIFEAVSKKNIFQLDEEMSKHNKSRTIKLTALAHICEIRCEHIYARARSRPCVCVCLWAESLIRFYLFICLVCFTTVWCFNFFLVRRSWLAMPLVFFVVHI